jgi:hypothetical protein
VTKFLDHAVAHFLASNDVTVTKFLQDNDISVTKFLENDISVTKFLGTASTRFLETNDISVTKFLDVTVTKFLSSNETAITKYLAANDVSVTKFMEAAITNFLLDSQAVDNYMLDNEISITKFLNSEDGIAVTKYLDSSSTPTVNQSNGMGQQNINMTIIEFLEKMSTSRPIIRLTALSTMPSTTSVTSIPFITMSMPSTTPSLLLMPAHTTTLKDKKRTVLQLPITSIVRPHHMSTHTTTTRWIHTTSTL